MRLSHLAAAGLFALASCVAHAQSYPSQPVSIVVGFTPGGSNDILARLIAPRLSEALKVPVHVDNKAGANGHIGLQYVARAKPDGYTIYLGSASPLVLNPIVNKSVKFSVDSDVVAVNTVAKTFQVVATESATKFKNFKQLVDAGRDRSQTVTVGTSGIAGNNHVLLEVINAATGAKLLHVPYKGTGPAIVDAMPGHISAIIADYPGILAVKDGNGLSVLAVAEAQRSRLLPDVPTIGEALNLGTDIDLSNWFAVVAPKGTPESVRKVLFDAVSFAAADKGIQDKLTAAGYLSFSQTSVAATEQFIAAENAKWKSLVDKPQVQRNLQN